MLLSNQLEFIMEAHNGLSAGIVEETGFKGIWGSGLSISASLGVRDSNEASWTQVLDVLEFMSDRTSIPILLDGDTGYGNFNNARRLITKLEQRDIAGVCMEDKLFPKTNSFINSAGQPLADVEEFSLKIRACKDTQKDPDFCVIARVEAFIAGWPLEEALMRAHAYADAGADAVLIHSKLATDEQIQLFMKYWDGKVPVVIVPTKYYQVPTENFEKAGISLVIWANHLCRTSISAMQNTAKQIFNDRSLKEIEPHVVPVSEVFRLQRASELSQAEKIYLPDTAKGSKAIILAASKGNNLGTMTDDKPKCMIEVRGKSILGSMIENFQDLGVKKISVVTGYKKEVVQFQDVNLYENERFDETGELFSLATALDEIQGQSVIAYGDVLLQRHYLTGLLSSTEDIVLLIDANCPNKKTGRADLVKASQEYNLEHLNDQAYIREIGVNLEGDVHGEMVGVIKLSAKGAEVVKQAIQKLQKEAGWEKMALTDLVAWILKNTEQPVALQYVLGGWLDIDNFEDLSKAYN